METFLRETAIDRLEGQPKFHARVAANAVAIVRRELALDAAASADEVGRLSDLTGRDGDREGLNGLLADTIREGDLDDPAAVLAHLRQTAREKLAVMPGESFGMATAGHVRVSLCNPVEILGEAASRLKRYAAGRLASSAA